VITRIGHSMLQQSLLYISILHHLSLHVAKRNFLS